MLELHNVRMELSNVRMEPSNVRKKSKRTTKCEKITVTCDVGTAQYKNRTFKCEKKVREPPNVRKNCHMWYWNCKMWKWNRQVWEKSKETTQYEKRTVTCDIGTAQCEDGTVKCEKKVTWYSRLPTSGYRTHPPPPLFWGGTVELPNIYCLNSWVSISSTSKFFQKNSHYKYFIS